MTRQSTAQEFGFIPQFNIVDTETYSNNISHAIGSLPNPQFDYKSLNIFFRTGMFLNGDTPFRDIKRVLPSPLIVAPREISYSDAIEKYIALFQQAIARAAPEQSTIALSGGRDSRHILFELWRAKKLPDYAITAAIPGRDSEVEIAKKLVKKLDVNHRIVSNTPCEAAQNEFVKNLLCDYSSLEHGWAVCISNSRDSLPLWDGIAGDILSAGLLLDEWRHNCFKNDCLDELAETLVQKGPLPYVRDQSLYPRDSALIAIRSELEKHKAAANPIGSFYFWNRTRVQIASSAFKLFRPSSQETLAPYLDKDLWEFLSSIPAEMLIDKKFHDNVILKAYPEFADITYATSSQCISNSEYRERGLSLLKYTFSNKGSQRISFLARTIRSLLVPPYVSEIGWLLPLFVYCTQLESHCKTELL